MWSFPPAAATVSYIRDTTSTLEPSLASPPGGPEEKYYCALGYGKDVNGMGTRDWYLMHYSSSSLTGGQKHTHTIQSTADKCNATNIFKAKFWAANNKMLFRTRGLKVRIPDIDSPNWEAKQCSVHQGNTNTFPRNHPSKAGSGRVGRC